MKAQTKMIAASLVVIMLALSAVGGITYSWFSASDEADVNITTGTVNIATYGNVGELDRSTEGFKSINEPKFVPGQSIEYNYEVTNNSNIDIVYQWSVSIEPTCLENGYTIDGLISALSFNYGTVTVDPEDSTKILMKSSWQKWTQAEDKEKTGTLVIGLDEEWTYQNLVLVGKVKIEAYQGDYSTGDVTASVSNNTATVDSSTISLNNTIQTGEFTGEVGNETIKSSIKFDTSSTENLVNEANGGNIEITVEKVEPPAHEEVANIPADLKLGIEVTVKAGSSEINNLGGTADVTITVPGQYEGKNVQIWYLDGTTPELMPIVSVTDSNDGQTSTIVFTTTHFSTFYFGEVENFTAVYTADQLIEALENGENVGLMSNIKIDPASMSNAYGTTGINVKNGQTIDGNGFTLDIKGAGGTWDSGINTTGGLIKDLTVTGSFRGIFINHNSTHSEPVILDNVTIEGTTYTISCDQGLKQGLVAINSTFKGWTSYAATLGDAKFVNCNFGEGNGYAYCRPYAPTEFVGCTFNDDYTMDPRAPISFKDCTIGDDTAVTNGNLSSLVVDSYVSNVTVI